MPRTIRRMIVCRAATNGQVSGIAGGARVEMMTNLVWSVPYEDWKSSGEAGEGGGRREEEEGGGGDDGGVRETRRKLGKGEREGILDALSSHVSSSSSSASSGSPSAVSTESPALSSLPISASSPTTSPTACLLLPAKRLVTFSATPPTVHLAYSPDTYTRGPSPPTPKLTFADMTELLTVKSIVKKQRRKLKECGSECGIRLDDDSLYD